MENSSFLQVGGIVININHLTSFKVTQKGKTYYLKLFMLDGRGYNISYENVEHLIYDVKQIENKMNN